MTANRLAAATPFVPLFAAGLGELIPVLPQALVLIRSLTLNPSTWTCVGDILQGLPVGTPPPTPCGAVGSAASWVYSQFQSHR